MKNKSDIEKRLRSLRVKYAKRYVAESQTRSHQNCIYNRVHTPLTRTAPSPSPDTRMVPRKHVTLVVLQPDSPVRLCMYGSDNPASWPGNICDSDDISRSCKMFKPGTSAKQAREDFLSMLADDEWVFDNYRDMAALQWVLSDRLHRMELSWWERLMFWMQVFLLRRERPAPQLPESDIPEDLWTDDAPPPSP